MSNAREPQPVIIEAALNGATPKSRNPHVPRTPDEIAADGLRCIAAGATIVHNHNDEPVVGGPARHAAEPYIAAWRPILAQHPDVVLYPTMGSGGPHTTIEERYAHIPELAVAGLLRAGLVDPGSVNVGPVDAEGLPAAVDSTYINTFRDARYMFATCAELELGPSISIFEPGFLRVALAWHRAGQMPRGALVKLYFGGPNANFGLPPTAAGLEAYVEMLSGTGLPWSVAVLGGDVLSSDAGRLALERGGHIRVGLEDYVGPDTPSNEDLVRRAVKLCGSVGRPVATIKEANQLLDLVQQA